jgi:O-antigen ligase
VWARGRAYWRANPILGVGAGNFGVAEGEFNADTGRTGKWSAAHNAYIQALAELGTFGGGLFIAMLLVGAAAAFPLWRGGSPSSRGPPRLQRPELLASLAASASAAYFLSHAYFSPLYGVLALIALADRTAKAESSGGGAAAEPAGVPGVFRLPGQRGGLALVRFSPRPMMRGVD